MSKLSNDSSMSSSSHSSHGHARGGAPPIETVADLLDAARAHGLRLTTEHHDFDKTGLDFLVLHAKDEEGVPWVVRTPRRPAAYEVTHSEARVLALVRPKLPVSVPDWRVHAPDVIAYPRLMGIPAVTVDAEGGGPTWNILDPSAPSDRFVESFASALIALQNIELGAAQDAGVPAKTVDDVRHALARTMAETRASLSPPDAVWARWHRWLEDATFWPSHVALVHGDLHPGHMLLDPEGSLVGILDWTEACMSDPSMDFAMYFGCFGRPALEALVARFESAGGRIWPRLIDHAVERWAAFPALAAEWALRAGNDAILEYARGQLAALQGAPANV